MHPAIGATSWHRFGTASGTALALDGAAFALTGTGLDAGLTLHGVRGTGARFGLASMASPAALRRKYVRLDMPAASQG